MAFDGRKSKEWLYRHCSGRGPKDNLIPALNNAYDEVERLQDENKRQNGDLFYSSCFVVYEGIFIN